MKPPIIIKIQNNNANIDCKDLFWYKRWTKEYEVNTIVINRFLPDSKVGIFKSP